MREDFLLLLLRFVELGREVRTEKDDQACYIDPRHQRYNCSHPSVDPLVVEQRDELGEDVAPQLPKDGGDDRAGQSLEPIQLPVWQQLINDQKDEDCQGKAGSYEQRGP